MYLRHIATCLVFASFILAQCLVVDASISLGTCQLSCNENEDHVPAFHGSQGPPGERGAKGEIGPPGPIGPQGECEKCDNLQRENGELKAKLNKLEGYMFIRDCVDAKSLFLSDGVYVIFPSGTSGKGIQVYCDQLNDGGGWIVVQRRMDGSENFFRQWDDYVNGFGVKEREFWLGLEAIHLLTANGTYEIRFDLVTKNGQKIFAKYSNFRLAGADDNYRIDITGYNGNAGDSMAHHNGMQFSTMDSDNDRHSSNCANSYKGGWWYNQCHTANPNGLYDGLSSTGMSWKMWKNDYTNFFKAVDMKIRRV